MRASSRYEDQEATFSTSLGFASLRGRFAALPAN